jgi:hypothetical protein
MNFFSSNTFFTFWSLSNSITHLLPGRAGQKGTDEVTDKQATSPVTPSLCSLTSSVHADEG